MHHLNKLEDTKDLTTVKVGKQINLSNLNESTLINLILLKPSLKFTSSLLIFYI